LTPYLKKEGTATASNPSDDETHPKVPTKAKINLIFWKWSFR
jgi:hypothetical protein